MQAFLYNGASGDYLYNCSKTCTVVEYMCRLVNSELCYNYLLSIPLLSGQRLLRLHEGKAHNQITLFALKNSCVLKYWRLCFSSKSTTQTSCEERYKKCRFTTSICCPSMQLPIPTHKITILQVVGLGMRLHVYSQVIDMHSQV